MLQYNPSITGSLQVTGSLLVTGNEAVSGSLTVLGGIIGAITGSATSASYAISASEASTLQGLGSASFAPAATFNTVSQSYASASGSLSTRVTTNETNIATLTSASASFATMSGSLSTRVTNLEATSSTVSQSFASTSGSISSRVTLIEGQYATTGSNNFTKPQQISDVSNAISFTSTASLYTEGGLRVKGSSFISGTAYFNDVVVYGTSSIEYITSSQIAIGTNLITLNTDTPSVRYGGISVFDSGSNNLSTGSLFWDSEKDKWIYSNPSGSTYDGGMLISGPRNTSGIGNEVGTTSCALMMGQGGDHITSSAIFSYGNATCFYGQSYISSSGAACFGNAVAINAPASGQGLVINNRTSDNTYGSINFYKCDGTTFQSQILNSNIGTNGGQLSFYTKPDGGSSTLAMTICSNQTAVFASCVTTGQLTATVSSGTNIELNKGTGPSIAFNKTNATAQSWLLSADPNFRVYDSTVGCTYLSVSGGTGWTGLSTTSPCTLFDVRCYSTFGSCGTVANSTPIASFVVNATDNGCRGLQIGSTSGGVASAPVFLKVFGTSAPFAILNQSNCAGLTIDANNIATFACQVCALQYRGYNYGVSPSGVFRGGLYVYNQVSGTGTDCSLTIFSEGGANGGHFYVTTGGSSVIRQDIDASGVTCFSCTVCAPTFRTNDNAYLTKASLRLRSTNDGNYLDVQSTNTCNIISSNYGNADTPIILGSYTGYQCNQLYLATNCGVGIRTNLPYASSFTNSGTAIQQFGPYYGKMYIQTTNSAFSNPTVTVFQFGGSYPYAQTIIKVRVIQNSVSGGYSSIHVGYAQYVQDSGGAFNRSTACAMSVEYAIGLGYVGTLSWSGTCLQYTGNRMTNYDAYLIEVEYGSNFNINTTPAIYPG